MAIITLKNWYQLDFVLPDVPSAKSTILKIDALVSELQSMKLVKSWFFLYEGSTIRVRMSTSNGERLKKSLSELVSKHGLEVSEKLPFSQYQESDEMMFNEAFIRSFAVIMCETTKLTISKLKNDINFDNYRVLERLQHCMFNNLMTLSFKPEEYFLKQRLLERIGQPNDKDFGNKQ